MPKKPVDVTDYDRIREGNPEHVSEYTRMQEVAEADREPALLALKRRRIREAGGVTDEQIAAAYDQLLEDFYREDSGIPEGDQTLAGILDRLPPETPTERVVEWWDRNADMDAAWERRHYIDTHHPDGTDLGPGDDPARPWDRVLWGLGEMAAAAGLVATPAEGYDEAGNIWHSPTASYDDSYTRQKVVDGMEAWLGPAFGEESRMSEEERLERARERVDFGRQNYWRIAHAERAIPTKDELDRTVEIELDAAIKNDYPQLRRNTKRYKELFESHKAGARKFYATAAEKAKEFAIEDLERQRKDMAEPSERLRHGAEYQLRRVAWIEALKPGSEIAARERRIAEREIAMADEYDRTLNDEIARVRGLAVGREGTQPAI